MKNRFAHIVPRAVAFLLLAPAANKISEKWAPMMGLGAIRNLLRRTICWGTVLLAGIGIASQAAAEDMVGSMIGSISGWVTDANGQQVAPQAAVSGDVAISTDAQGNIVATVTGTGSCTGGLGVHIDYTVSYNTGTGALSGTYTDPANATPRSIQFTHQGGLRWQGSIADSVVVDGENRPYNLQITLELPATAIYSGSQFPADRQLSGPLSSDLNLTVPVSLPQFGINQTINTTITVAGQWVANLVPQADGSTAITGHASGTYSSPTISLQGNVNVMGTQVSIPISFALNGRFGGSLFQDNGTMFFAGTYGESIQSSTSGLISYSINYSGDLLVEVPVDAGGSISQLPFSFSGTPLIEVGSILGSLGSFTVPIEVNGIFPFSMN